MTIIPVANPKELPRERMRGYVCMSPMEAAQAHKEHYGVMPAEVFQYTNTQGKTTCFVVEDAAQR